MQLEIPLWLLREVLDDLLDQRPVRECIIILYTFYVHVHNNTHRL